MLKSKIKSLLLIGVMSIGFAGSAFAQKIEVENDLWKGDSVFDDVLTKADTKNIPIFAFYGKEGCGNCNTVIGNLNSVKFQNFMDESNMLFAYKKNSSSGSSISSKIGRFAKVGQSKTSLPYMRVYWKKADGTVVSYSFQGSTPTDTIIKNIKKYTSGYVSSPVPEYAGGYFSIGSTNACARLETIKTTDDVTENTVYVPLHRDAAVANVATNQTLSVRSHENEIVTHNVVWDKGATNLFMTLKLTNISGDISLTLLDGTNEVDMTTIFALDADYPNSAGNPKFTGAEPGVWTMDLDAVTNATAAATDPAYTLAVVGASVWCPFCLVAEKDWFSSDVFKNYASTTGLYLASIDNLHITATNVLEITPPSLLSYGSKYEKVTQYRPAGIYSGAAYLSRNQISPERAKEISDRNWNIACKDWVVPDGKQRLGFPTFVLLRKDGSIVGRVPGVYSGTLLELNVTWDAEAATQRIADLIACDTPFEEKNNFIETTTDTITLQATGLVTSDTPSYSISASDLTDTWKIVGKPGTKAMFRIIGTSVGEYNATLSIVEKSADGSTNTLARTVGVFSATGDSIITPSAVTGRLLTVEAILTTNDCFLMLKGDKETTFSATKKDSTVCRYMVESEICLVPTEAKQLFELASGSSLNLEVVSNTLYKITGGTIEDYGVVETVDSEKGLYRAIQNGKIIVKSSEETTIEYQIWNPGKIKFVETSLTYNEMTDSKGTISVTRSNGSSGACKISFTLNTENISTDRFTWDTDSALSWADGETGTKTVEFGINATRDVFEGNQSFTVGLKSSEGFAEVSEEVCTVRIYETDKPVFGTNAKTFTMNSGFDFEESMKIHNISNATAIVKLKKIGRGSLPTGITAKYDKDTQSVVFKGTPKKAGKYVISYAVTERRGRQTVEGEASVFTFEVIDTATLNGYYGKSITVKNIPLAAVDAKKTEGNAICGTADVTISRSGRITVKYYSPWSSPVSMSTDSWGVLFENNILMTGEIRSKKGNITCMVAVYQEGQIVVEINDPAQKSHPLFTAEENVGITGIGQIVQSSKTAFSGYYTITLPVKESVKSNLDDISFTADDIPSGVGYLTATIKEDGSVRYSGILPDGEAVSGSSAMMDSLTGEYADSSTGDLPLFLRKNTDVLALAMSVKKEAKTNHKEERDSILSLEEIKNYWMHQEKNEIFKFHCTLDVFGGFYDPLEDLDECCNEAYKTGVHDVVVGGETFGTVNVDASKIKVTDAAAGTNLKLTFTKKTGLFKGSFKMKMDNESKVKSVNYKGVLLPGWAEGCNECGDVVEGIVSRPFGSGTVYFKDGKIGRVSVQRGISVNLQPQGAID